MLEAAAVQWPLWERQHRQSMILHSRCYDVIVRCLHCRGPVSHERTQEKSTFGVPMIRCVTALEIQPTSIHWGVIEFGTQPVTEGQLLPDRKNRPLI
jgi:hypothetical protein